MTSNLELIVRPFARQDVTKTISPQFGPERASPGVVILDIGKDGDAQTFDYRYSMSVQGAEPKSRKFREVKRTVLPVRVENPNDPEDFVEVERTKQVTIANEKDPKQKFTYTWSVNGLNGT